MHELTDTAELAAELSAVDGVPLAEAQTLAAAHLGHITREAGAPAQVNISDRPYCNYCTGPHTDAECPLRRPVFVVPEPADMPLRFRARELRAEIVDWGQHGYVLVTDEGQVTIGAPGQDPLCLSLEQARELRALLALPQVRSLLMA